ncbi:MAG: hypothetical protein ABI380_09630 [Edaphobacter sp.]
MKKYTLWRQANRGIKYPTNDIVILAKRGGLFRHERIERIELDAESEFKNQWRSVVFPSASHEQCDC